MVERGDAGWNRKTRPDRITLTGHIIRAIGRLMELSRRGGGLDTFTPDLLIDESFDLASYGLGAKVLHLPGHSRGSIGLLTADGDLICGDLLYNWRKPSVPFVDDGVAHDASIAKLHDLGVHTVYPGHGKPFACSEVARW
jgi:hydroxyacylglutathione hydrolase